MFNTSVLDLEDCTEFGRSLANRPPGIVHKTLIGLAGLVTSAGLWLAVTKADLVVVASGRIRPAASSNALPGDTPEELTVAPFFGGRVVEVHVRVGDQIHHGDPLVRLDTQRIDNEIARAKRTIRAGGEELARLERLMDLLRRQYETARAKTAAELELVETDARRDESDRQAEIRLAQLDCDLAGDKHRRLQQLAGTRAVSESELVEAAIRSGQAKARHERAQHPLDDRKCQVARLALQLVERDYGVRIEEQQLEKERRRAELEAATLDLANLELEREQAGLFAPAAGVITSVDVGVGDLLEPGEAAMTIVQQQGFRLDVDVPSHEVGHLSVGLPAHIRLDAFDSRRYGTLNGRVTFLAPDSNTSSETGSEQTVTYSIQIALERSGSRAGQYLGRVKLGMTGQAEIITGQESILSLFLHRIRQTISLSAGGTQ